MSPADLNEDVERLLRDGPMLPLIGLTGRAGAGKDTVFELLARDYPDHVSRRAFADQLKVSAMAALGLHPIIADKFKEQATITIEGLGATRRLTGRQYLQHYGLEAHRELFGDDFWTRRVLNPWLLDHGTITVITDVRMNDEAEDIRHLGGEVWLIDRDHEGIAETDHATEQGIDRRLVDRRIVNNGTLDDLGDQVAAAFGAWLDSQINGEEAAA